MPSEIIYSLDKKHHHVVKVDSYIKVRTDRQFPVRTPYLLSRKREFIYDRKFIQNSAESSIWSMSKSPQELENMQELEETISKSLQKLLLLIKSQKEYNQESKMKEDQQHEEFLSALLQEKHEAEEFHPSKNIRSIDTVDYVEAIADRLSAANSSCYLLVSPFLSSHYCAPRTIETLTKLSAKGIRCTIVLPDKDLTYRFRSAWKKELKRTRLYSSVEHMILGYYDVSCSYPTIMVRDQDYVWLDMDESDEKVVAHVSTFPDDVKVLANCIEHLPYVAYNKESFFSRCVSKLRGKHESSTEDSHTQDVASYLKGFLETAVDSHFAMFPKDSHYWDQFTLDKESELYDRLLLDDKLEQYRDSYIAIYGDQLVCSGASSLDVKKVAYRKHGYVPMLIRRVPKKGKCGEKLMFDGIEKRV